jgi:hypothetical protein
VPEIERLLQGEDLADHAGLTFLLLTTGPDGWPHVAMLSVGEVLATSAVDVHLALWPASGASANLRRQRMATMMLVSGGSGYYVRMRVREMPDLELQGSKLAHFAGSVEEVLLDEADYASLVSGVTFQLHHEDVVLKRWRIVVEALRQSSRA